MANRLMQSSKIVEENLSCRGQLILSGVMELFTIEPGKVCVRLYTCHDEASLLRERPDRLPQEGEWRGDKGQREMTDDPVDRIA